jgi:PAS domain S-box-containing protein
MKNFQQFLEPETKGRSRNLFLPLAGLAIVWAGNSLFHSVVIGPLLSTVALVLLALLLRPRVLVFWAGIYVISTFFLLRSRESIFSDAAIGATNTYIRTFSFFLFALTVMLICLQRHWLQGQTRTLLHLLEKIPSAVFLTDGEGLIVFANKNALRIAGLNLDTTTGLSFFTLFEDKKRQGSSIQQYLELFQGALDQSIQLNLCSRENPGLALEATLSSVDLNGTRYVLSLIDPSAQSSR